MNALPEAIRIAIGAPLSGSAAAPGAEMKQAIELAVEEQNAEGGIAGLPILLEAADDKGKVETGRQIADAFCDRPDLLGIVGHYNRNVTIAAAEIYAAHDLAMITPIASDPAHRVKAFLSCPALCSKSTNFPVARDGHNPATSSFPGRGRRLD
jgi:branched-chain amino acid transport system substrate-binding protein